MGCTLILGALHWDRVLRVFASWFGVGFLVPKRQGTVGTLAALPLAALLAQFPPLGGERGWSPGLLVGGLFLLMSGAVASSAVEAQLQQHDPPEIVVDEVMGMCMTLAFLPSYTLEFIGTYVIGFLLFRAFDAWKPGPIGQIEFVRRGWGVMLDDLLAGLVAGGILGVAAWCFPAALCWPRS